MAKASLVALWRSRLAACKASGLSIQRWCELNGTTYRQYGYWRQRLSCLPEAAETDAAAPPQSTQWAVVEKEEVQHVPLPGLTLRIAGASIELQPGFDPDLLRSVVAALGGSPCSTP